MLRIVQNRDIKTNVQELYRKYHTLPLDQLFVMHVLLFMYKLKHLSNALPQCFGNLIISNADVHLHATRQCEDFSIYRYKSNYGSRCLAYLGAKLWSTLTFAAKNCNNIKLFKDIIYEQLQSEKSV
jgi:hypothetical protein